MANEDIGEWYEKKREKYRQACKEVVECEQYLLTTACNVNTSNEELVLAATAYRKAVVAREFAAEIGG